MKKGSLRRALSFVMAVIFLVSSVLVSDVAFGTQVTAAEKDDKDALGNEKGITTQNDVGDNGRGVIYADSRTDFRDETIYFVITTRFYDGDPSNNARTAEDDNKAHNPENDPSWRGDFKGLIEKLDYIKALGFTAVWITPVVQNDSGYDYHGYHAYDFSAVDYRYESNGVTYQDLIDACHAKGMKIIQDIVLNHTCNWGEKNLLQITDPVYAGGRSEVVASGKYDTENIYHHNGFCGGSDWDNYSAQNKTIHDDCFDLETENPKVYNYLVDCYKKYINMGVDGFRVDTVKHISRLTFNSVFMPAFKEAGGDNFYMFGEVCTKGHDVWYREQPGISTSFYTWADDNSWTGRWSDDLASNEALVEEHYAAHSDMGNQPTSKNAFLDGNNYHKPDYSEKSYMDVIDFQMHWSFNSARSAFDMAKAQDKYFNDSTWNVVYVDSHDYAPDECQTVRYTGGTDAWAENLSLMFTFRGIPCVYYGSEIEFQKGKPIDVGPSTQLANTGRAYFGDHIEGSVDVADFARYTNATGEMAETLNSPLSLHIQRLNRLRAAIPALRKGQYSTDGCSGSIAFKRRYTDSSTDSFALVALSGDATFTGIPNGKYTDAITGDVQNVSGGTLSATGLKGQGDLRVYVLDTDLTKAPGMIDGRSEFMSGGCDVVIDVVKPTGISLDKTSANLDLGETAKFTATVSPADATNKSVAWKSSDTSVATVGGNGQVTAKGEGTAIIYAATSNATAADYDNNSNLVAKATVTVKATGVRVTSLNLSKNSVTLDGGEAVKITTTVLPPNASPKYAEVTWASSNEEVAKVSSTGVITGVKKGNATITATTMDGVSATVDVEVKGTVIYGNAIYFEKPSDWSNNIKMYMWSDEPKWENAAWPGVSMSLIDEEKGVYGIEWPEGKSNVNVVFNDGGSNKTDDIKNVKMNGYYDNTGFVKEEPTKEKPSEEPTKPSEDPTKPSEDPTKPSEDPTKPSEDPTKPSEDPTKPSEDPTKPSEDPTKPSEDPTKPSEDPTKPSEDPTKPSEDPTKPSEDPTKPSEDPTKPSEDPTKPSEDPTKPSENPTKPSEDPTKPSEDPTKPSEDPTQPPVKELKIESFKVTVAGGMLEKGKTVKLKASVSNAQGKVKYRFIVKSNNITTIIKNYSTRSYVNWKPSKSGKYTLMVYAKDDYKLVKKSISNYTVNDKLKISSFKTSVGSKKACVGKKIKLTSKVAGGTKKYMYKFSYKLGKSTKTISGYSKKSSVNWTPKKSGTYELRVYVKDAKTGNVVNKTIKKYVVKKK